MAAIRLLASDNSAISSANPGGSAMRDQHSASWPRSIGANPLENAADKHSVIASSSLPEL
jgi:hypothetical protein